MANPRPLDLDALRLSGIAKGLISSINDIDDHNFLARGLQSVPVPLQSRMARKYIDRYNQKRRVASSVQIHGYAALLPG
ncbi:hypothetical protein P4S65_11620 [Pseudoalteromonas sp. B131b]|uniref:hypothetical protein n=1 Tax=Pseudoalteromonas sp. B131b TaxID=630493 RepID=UPI00301CE261